MSNDIERRVAWNREYGTPYHDPDGGERHPSVSSVLVHFDFEHLSNERYRNASRVLAIAAYQIANDTPGGPDLVKTLNHLKIAKDWAVCAHVARDRRGGR